LDGAEIPLNNDKNVDEFNSKIMNIKAQSSLISFQKIKNLKHNLKKMETGKVFLGVLAGVAAGALLGVLFAPDKGSETRKRIVKKGSDTLDDINEKYNDILKAFNEKLELAKEEASDLFERGKHKVEDLKNDIKSEMS
jgi:gas vesicle protein